MIIHLLFLFYIYAAENFKTLEFSSGIRLKVEVADTLNKRAKGLMNRTQLPKDQGMLFIFDQPQTLSFWMKDTYIPLSIGYFDKNKVLKEIHQMEPQQMLETKQNLKSYVSRCFCQYALEVNQGWFKKNRIKVGTRFKQLDIQ